jgi:hypothetical protein
MHCRCVGVAGRDETGKGGEEGVQGGRLVDRRVGGHQNREGKLGEGLQRTIFGRLVRLGYMGNGRGVCGSAAHCILEPGLAEGEEGIGGGNVKMKRTVLSAGPAWAYGEWRGGWVCSALYSGAWSGLPGSLNQISVSSLYRSTYWSRASGSRSQAWRLSRGT